VKDRQKTCFRDDCRRKRKSRTQTHWSQKNPGYFLGRYENTKEWRAKNPDYQRLWRRKRSEIQDEMVSNSRVKSITFTIAVETFNSEIQDEIRLNLPVVVRTYGGMGGGREIQDVMALPNPDVVAIATCAGHVATQ